MLKDMKRASLRKSMILIMICLFLGIGLIFYGYNNVLAYFKGPVNLADSSINEIKDGTYGEIDLLDTYVYGAYSDQYRKKDSNETITHYYYMISVGKGADKKFMGVKVSAANYSDMEILTENTWSILNGEEVSDYVPHLVCKGTLKKMESDAYSNYVQCLTEMGFTSDEISNETINLMLVDGDSHTESFIFAGGGALLILFDVLILIYILSGCGQRKIKKMLNKKGTGMLEKAENDFVKAECFDHNIKVGKYFTFIVKGTKNIVICNDEIVWLYPHKCDHYTNGMHTGTIYTIIYKLYSKKEYDIKVSNENVCNGIIHYYNTLTRSIIYGYNDELKRKFLKNYSEFLEIAYNRNCYGELPVEDYYDNDEATVNSKEADSNE